MEVTDKLENPLLLLCQLNVIFHAILDRQLPALIETVPSLPELIDGKFPISQISFKR